MKQLLTFSLFLLIFFTAVITIKNRDRITNIPIIVNNIDNKYGNDIVLYYWISEGNTMDPLLIDKWNGNAQYFGIEKFDITQEKQYCSVPVTVSNKDSQEYKIIIMCPQTQEYIESVIIL